MPSIPKKEQADYHVIKANLSKFSAREIAERTGLSKRTIEKWRSGELDILKARFDFMIKLTNMDDNDV